MADDEGPPTINAEDLAKHVQDLPPELFNNIYQLTFTIDSNDIGVPINRAYKPPSLLQVDKASRAKFGKLYYGGTKFLIPDAVRYFPSWLRSLDHEFLKTPFQEIFFQEAATKRFLCKILQTKDPWFDEYGDLTNFVKAFIYPTIHPLYDALNMMDENVHLRACATFVKG